VISASPSGSDTILDWKIIAKVDWNIIFLLGGGFALSKGFQVCLHLSPAMPTSYYMSLALLHQHLVHCAVQHCGKNTSPGLPCRSLHRGKDAINISTPTIVVLTKFCRPQGCRSSWPM
jgi:hypothetical protein